MENVYVSYTPYNNTFHINYRKTLESFHGPLTRYVQLWVAHAPGMPGTFPNHPRVSDPDMHHGTCVTQVPWCMPGLLTSGFLWSRCGQNVSDNPGACATHNFAYLVRGPWEQELVRQQRTHVKWNYRGKLCLYPNSLNRNWTIFPMHDYNFMYSWDQHRAIFSCNRDREKETLFI